MNLAGLNIRWQMEKDAICKAIVIEIKDWELLKNHETLTCQFCAQLRKKIMKPNLKNTGLFYH